MSRTVAIPGDAEDVATALQELQSNGDGVEVVLELAEDYQEPREAWPLELEVGDKIQRLIVCATEPRSASFGDLVLTASGDATEILLR
eukprot:1027268-Amphidinium_carterae.1